MGSHPGVGSESIEADPWQPRPTGLEVGGARKLCRVLIAAIHLHRSPVQDATGKIGGHGAPSLIGSKGRFVVGGLAAIAAVVVVAGSASAAEVVNIANFSYQPSTLTVTAGTSGDVDQPGQRPPERDRRLRQL